MRGHEHLAHSVFKEIVEKVFAKDNIRFKFFEAHSYPFLLPIFKAYEALMEKFSPKMFLSYNVAIIEKA